MPLTPPSANAYWYAGQFVSGDTLTLSRQDPGLLYGATVFTTLRVYDYHLDHPWTVWAAHQARLTRSLQAFHWVEPDWEQVRQGAETLASYFPVLRVTIFPDGRELILGRSLPPDLALKQTQGVTVWVADAEEYGRSLVAHKTGNYLGSWLALQTAQRMAAQEAVLVNDQGHWLETSTGNLWGWAADQWWTPPLTAGILPGVMRSRLLQGLQQEQQTVLTAAWTPQRVSQFSFLAYTNSVVEVVPIQAVLQGASSVNYNPDYGKVKQLNLAWQSIVS
ncbi:MAG: aminotransferase class IV [Cyanobacteria bacterium P01_D01_bin.115]